jgi:hypothetical protein
MAEPDEELISDISFLEHLSDGTDGQPWDFTNESLNRMRFRTPQAGVSFLKALARRHGFKLCVRDGIEKPYFRLYCSFGDHSKGKTSTKKNGCPFQLWISRRRNPATQEDFYVVGPSRNLTHTCEPIVIPEPVLQEEVEKSIASLKKIGVAPFLICEYIAERLDVPITVEDVDRVPVDFNSGNCLQQTDSLEQFMHDTYGSKNLPYSFETYSIASENDTRLRVAAFVQTPDERAHIERYGDVIMLDGTQMDQLTLRWDVFPVTLIDCNKQVICGGVFFLGLQTVPVFLWVLEVLYNCCGLIWKTLLTDEDSALMAAVPQFCSMGNRDIVHRTCVFHKRRNFIKQINARGYMPQLRRELIGMVQIICCGEDADEVEETLDRMEEMAPDLATYLNNNVRPALGRFAACTRSSAFTLGYLATSPAESANAMMHGKIPRRRMELAELSQAISCAFAMKRSEALGQKTIPVKMGKVLNPLKNYIAPKILQKLVRYIRASINFVTDGQGDCLLVRTRSRDSEAAKERCYEVTDRDCQCGIPASAGLPCPHLICAYRELENGAFPAFLINRRWLTQEPGPAFDHIDVDWGRVIEKMEKEANGQDDGGMELQGEVPDPDVDFALEDEIPEIGRRRSASNVPSFPPPSSDHDRYNALMTTCKEIVRLASRDPELFTYVDGELQMLLEGLADLGVSGDVTEIDRPATTKRGRPRNKGFSKPGRPAKAQCILCKGHHKWNDCPHARFLRDEMERGQHAGTGRRRSAGSGCEFCGGGCVDPKRCPSVLAARNAIADAVHEMV